MSEILMYMKEETMVYWSGEIVGKITRFLNKYYIYKISNFLKINWLDDIVMKTLYLLYISTCFLACVVSVLMANL